MHIINNWPISYPREENHNEYLFWALVLVMGGVAYYTRQHEPSQQRGGKIQLLSRDQTEEWKGWMQFVFIMVSECLFSREKEKKRNLCVSVCVSVKFVVALWLAHKECCFFFAGTLFYSSYHTVPLLSQPYHLQRDSCSGVGLCLDDRIWKLFVL